jgi:hypothetical protein
MSGKVFVDTNILIYTHDLDAVRETHYLLIFCEISGKTG